MCTSVYTYIRSVSMYLHVCSSSLKATEQSSTRRSSTAVIELTIADLNDNFPVFVQPKYTMYVTENTRVSEGVLTVTAEDIDGVRGWSGCCAA